MFEELKLKFKKPVQIWVDNKSTICLFKNPVFHGRSKHIEIKFYFLRDQVSKGRIELAHCSTEDQVADAFTKSLKRRDLKS